MAKLTSLVAVGLAGYAGAACSVSFGPWSACRGAKCIPNAPVPGTALLATVDPAGLWLNDNLSSIPDIASTGPDFYTYNWTTSLGVSADCASTRGRLLFTLPQINYRATVFDRNGMTVPPLGLPAGLPYQAVGMFQRFNFDLGPVAAMPNGAVLSVVVQPPDHYGNTSACKGCGQGGNHELAKDVTAQDTLGWDWVAPVPDRNTGIIDPPELAVAGSALKLGDPVATVLNMELPPVGPDGMAPRSATLVNLSVTVGCLYFDPSQSFSGVLSLRVPELDVNVDAFITLDSSSGGWTDVTLPSVLVSNVALWWPHTLGQPKLYDAVLSFTPAALPAAAASSSSGPIDASAAAVTLSWRMGIRTVTSEVDAAMGGRIFRINGYRLFLQGGNFINPDMFLRGREISSKRYFNEVRMHQVAGMNLLRLWGGSSGHPPALYEAADELGMFVMFEWQMSGDNNGRWGGSYDYPLDQPLYLRAAADTIRMTRSYASLLLYCGGNELYPLNQSPPASIRAGLPALLAQLDPRQTPYVQSSMGSTYGSGNPQFDPDLTLAPLDGPYGILDERDMFTRNPGLYYSGVRADKVPIAFQPELGSMSCPEYDSLTRFMTADVLGAFPPINASGNTVGPVWNFYKYLPFQDDKGWDHAYSYGAPMNASEYAWRTQLAQVKQYQALFEGFQQYQWLWYGAMIMWKTQAPMPNFRGALYDVFGATNGGLWGVRSATGGGAPVHVQLNQGNNTVTVINKGIDTVAVTGWSSDVSVYDISTGAKVTSAGVTQPLNGQLAAGAVTNLPAVLQWPSGAVAQGAVLLYRVSLRRQDGSVASSSDYWFSSLTSDLTVHQDYAQLGKIRSAGPSVTLQASATGAVGTDNNVLLVNVTLSAPSDAPQVAFAVRAVLRDSASAVVAPTGVTDDRVLPQWTTDNYFSLVPGEQRSVLIEADWSGKAPPSAGQLRVTIDGWTVVAADAAVQLA